MTSSDDNEFSHDYDEEAIARIDDAIHRVERLFGEDEENPRDGRPLQERFRDETWFNEQQEARLTLYLRLRKHLPWLTRTRRLNWLRVLRAKLRIYVAADRLRDFAAGLADDLEYVKRATRLIERFGEQQAKAKMSVSCNAKTTNSSPVGASGNCPSATHTTTDDPWLPATWYFEHSNQVLNDNCLRQAAFDKRLQKQKNGNRNLYLLSEVCKQWPEHEQKLRRAFKSGDNVVR